MKWLRESGRGNKVGYTYKIMLAFSLELGTHYPCSLTLSTAREHGSPCPRPVNTGVINTGVIFDTRVHSLTFRVRRYVVIATKPVHRLQSRPIVQN